MHSICEIIILKTLKVTMIITKFSALNYPRDFSSWQKKQQTKNWKVLLMYMQSKLKYNYDMKN